MEHRSQFSKWGDNNDVPYGEYAEVNARKGRARNGQPPTGNPSPLHSFSDQDASKPRHEFTPNREGEEHLHLNDPARKRRVSGGADHNVDRSPLHARQQARTTSHSYNPNSSSSTPGRTKKPPGRGDPPVEKRSTVPKFGDWDENDPTSADNFTGIFKKVRDERKDGGKPPMISTDPEFEDNLRRSGKTSDTGCSCFGWFKK